LLIVRCGDRLMGDEFDTAEPPTLKIMAQASLPLAKVDVIRDNKYVFTSQPGETEIELDYTDSDAQPNEPHYYYVRVQQQDGNLAWASPMWIKYAP
jgi:hypothetical protein